LEAQLIDLVDDMVKHSIGYGWMYVEARDAAAEAGVRVIGGVKQLFFLVIARELRSRSR
jgi:hypothetical protein